MIGNLGVRFVDGGLESGKERKQEVKSQLEIIEMLEDFLEHRRLSVDGAFPLVSHEDLDSLVQIVHEIIGTKWEPDADGDYPVEVIFVNRNDRERLSFVPVKYRHLDKARNFKDIAFNLRAAMRDMALSLDLDDIEERSS